MPPQPMPIPSTHSHHLNPPTRKTNMKISPLLAAAALFGALATPGFAQQPNDDTKVTSSPGKASAARTRTVVATVTEIDPATRKLSIKGPKGDVSTMTLAP